MERDEMAAEHIRNFLSRMSAWHLCFWTGSPMQSRPRVSCPAWLSRVRLLEKATKDGSVI